MSSQPPDALKWHINGGFAAYKGMPLSAKSVGKGYGDGGVFYFLRRCCEKK
ncbi:hypothetical protein VA602_03445 [Pseudomonas sp. MH2]|jgi:hypothetical protein|uniref:Uncharacterized protein n=1 Tax=Pseudomonas machongensis TaxID=3110229 RepID=A0ABU5VAJ1_9PSED|nr:MULTISPECIES: hypothetical protein [unclassified Pseudomonas]MEA5670391.1 hypothetical protein [Pseudomonas sp. MH2]